MSYSGSEEEGALDQKHPSSTPANSRPQAAVTESLWRIPGFDKTDFYAAALYLHVSAKGQLRQPASRSDIQEVELPSDIPGHDFLDRLADCFARSKSKDAQAHVSATAMAIYSDEHKIKLFVAKNLSGENMARPQSPPSDSKITMNEDDQFAKQLSRWFTALSCNVRNEQIKPVGSQPKDMREIIYEFNTSRLEYYVLKIRDSSEATADDFRIWPVASEVIQACQRYGQMNGPKLNECADLALQCRQHSSFDQFSHNLDGLLHDDGVDVASKQFARTVKWINYLGRLGDIYSTLSQFCQRPVWRGFTYEVVVLKSPDEECWDPEIYSQRINSWTGDLGLDEERKNRNTARSALDDFVSKAGSRRTARVHCEIQLLNYFATTGEKCGRYLGCSKTSCWLCWQLLKNFGEFRTKDSHRMIYPMWAVPSDFSQLNPRFIKALSATYRDMITLIQQKVLFGKDFTSQVNKTHSSIRLGDLLLLQPPSALIPSSASVLSSSSAHTSSAVTLSSIHTSSSTTTSDAESLWSSATLQNKWRQPLGSCRIIHLPAADIERSDKPLSPQIIQVDYFSVDDSVGHGDTLRNHIGPFQIDDKKVLFSFQENTWNYRPQRMKEIGLLEAEELLWCRTPINTTGDNKIDYMIFFRLNEENLSPNPWLLETLKGILGEEAITGYIPWFGDTFIVPKPRSGRHDMLELDGFNIKDCLETLESTLKSQNGQEYAMMRESGYEQLGEMMQNINYRLLFDGIHHSTRHHPHEFHTNLLFIASQTRVDGAMLVKGVEEMVRIWKEKRQGNIH